MDIPIFEYEQLVGLDGTEKAAVKDFIDRILTGDAIVNAPWRFWKPSFSWNAHRLLLKITDANSLINWFGKSYNIPIVFLTRHPIPQSLSCIKLDWKSNSKFYLRKEDFVDRYLTSSQEAISWDIIRTGTQREKFVLNWTLENLVPLRESEQSTGWTWISYEEAVMEPDQFVTNLCEQLSLSSPAKMRAMIGNPSKTTRSEIKRVISGNRKGHDRLYLVERWKQKVGKQEEKSLMSILHHFDINHYQFNRVMPVRNG